MTEYGNCHHTTTTPKSLSQQSKDEPIPIELTGEYTDAQVMVDDESLVEENCLEQIQTLIHHPAFTEPVRAMPDAHVGAGAPVGFTMPLPDQVVPNIVGLDGRLIDTGHGDNWPDITGIEGSPLDSLNWKLSNHVSRYFFDVCRRKNIVRIG